MNAKSFLFVSLDGLIGDIAWRVQQEGHGVKYAITADVFSQDLADGILPKADDWASEVEWADIVVFDDALAVTELSEDDVYDIDEGVDVPAANVDVLLVGSGSEREFTQRLGRILRPNEDGSQALLYEVVSEETAAERVAQRRR